MLADQGSDSGSKRTAPPLSEFPPEVELLAAIYNRLGELLSLTPTNHPSGKGKPVQGIKPWPSPVTAFDRVRAQRSASAFSGMAMKLFPEKE